MVAEVTTLYESNARDIPAMLRMAADRIEAGGTETKCIIAVELKEDGEIELYGWGATDLVHATGVLALGLQRAGLMQLSE